MKKFNPNFLLLAAAMSLCLWGCKTDLDDVNARLDNLEKEVTALRSLIEKANNDIASLQTTVESLRNSVTISNVEETSDGYIIHFSNGKKSELSNGKTPAVSVEYDAATGNYYWKVNGDYLTDKDGNKIAANGKDGEDGGDGGDGKDGKDAPLPRLEMGINLSGTDKEGRPIVAEAWYVSVDEGATWARVSASADELKFELTVSGNEIIIKFADGTELKVPFVEGFYFIPERTVVKVNYGQTVEIPVDQNKVLDTHISNPGGWKTTVSGNNIFITAPDASNPYAETEGVVSILAMAQGGFVAIAKINVVAGVMLGFQDVAATYESWGMENSMETAYKLVFTTSDYDGSAKTGAMLSLDARAYVTGLPDGISQAYEGMYENGSYAAYYFGSTTPNHRNMIQDTPDSKLFAAMLGNEEIRLTDAEIQVKKTDSSYKVWGTVMAGDIMVEIDYEGEIEFGKAIIHLGAIGKYMIGYDWRWFVDENANPDGNDIWWFQNHNMDIANNMFVNPPGEVVQFSITVPYIDAIDAYTHDIEEGTYEYAATGQDVFKIIELTEDKNSQHVNNIIFYNNFLEDESFYIVGGNLVISRTGTGTSARYNFQGNFILDNGMEAVVLAENKRVSRSTSADSWAASDLKADLDLTGLLSNYDYWLSNTGHGPEENVYRQYLYLGSDNIDFYDNGTWGPEDYGSNDHVVQLGLNNYAHNNVFVPGRYVRDDYAWVPEGNNMYFLDFPYLPDTYEWSSIGNLGHWGFGTQYVRGDEKVIGTVWGENTNEGFIDISNPYGNYYEIEFELYDDTPRKRPNQIKGDFKGDIVVDPGDIPFNTGLKHRSAANPYLDRPAKPTAEDITRARIESYDYIRTR